MWTQEDIRAMQNFIKDIPKVWNLREILILQGGI